MRRLNLEFNNKLKKRLCENKKAIQHLTNRGLTIDIIEYFGLGLSLSYYSKKSGCYHADALMYPLRAPDGKFYNKYGYYNIPSVTLNPLHTDGWMNGKIQSYLADRTNGKKCVFICSSPRDLWRHWMSLRNSSHAQYLLLISSTHNSEFPPEWEDMSYWNGWETVFLGYDNDETGNLQALKLAELIGREARRVLVPRWYGKDWTDFWNGGGDLAEFRRLLRDALPISLKVDARTMQGMGSGRFAYRPVNINGAFHNGHLYYTTQVVNRDTEIRQAESGEKVVQPVERLETVVIRSDQSIHSAVRGTVPKGTKENNRVLRLTDGTLLERELEVNRHATWHWDSIKSYIEGKARTRYLAEILRDVKAHLKNSFWLPHEEDYSMLTLAVPVTFTQSIFASVPLILLDGLTGSVKRDIGLAMARVCANAYICGHSSAASIAGFINESRGFVVLGDLEALGSKGTEYEELVEALKLGYNKEPILKLWSGGKASRSQPVDLYGVKMINSTPSTDDIPRNCAIRIRTCKIPGKIKGEFSELRSSEKGRLTEIRNELHTWAFLNVKLIEAEYMKLYPKSAGRSEDVSAPLRVMASLAGDVELQAQLEAVLARQRKKPLDFDNSKEALMAALKNLIIGGYEMISPTQLVLEIRSMFMHERNHDRDNEMPEWIRPECVGRMLRNYNLVDDDPSRSIRKRIRGANLRFYPIRTSYIEQIRRSVISQNVAAFPSRKEPEGFCTNCDSCAYSQVGCELMLETTNRPEAEEKTLQEIL